MNIVKIKPLSVNQCFQGRRFKTKAYKAYENAVFRLLPKGIVTPRGYSKLTIEFGYSSKLADIDNGLKPFLDILQKYYCWNDRFCEKLIVKKSLVSKGEEFIKFKFEEI